MFDVARLILISSCDFLDTAQYCASALNVKGEASSVATIVVKSKLNCFLFCFFLRRLLLQQLLLVQTEVKA